MTISTELKAFGSSQVLVFMKVASPTTAAARVTRHFKKSRSSRMGALAAEEGVPGGGPAFRHYRNLGIMLGTVDESAYKAIRKLSAVSRVLPVPELSLIRPVAAAEALPKVGPTWGIKRLGVPDVWKKGYTGKGVLIAHLDTGVDANHPVLKGAIAHFAEFDSLGREVQGAKARDSGTHGTHTAATIAGRPTKQAIVGVAPDATLASAMVIEGGNVVARILGGMDWALGHGARVLSMSLGLRGYREEFLLIVRTLRAKGMLPVIAVGNEDAGTSRSPGNYDISLSVGACDSQDEVPEFSSSQRFKRKGDPLVPDIVGPGVEVLSAMPGKAYGVKDGTSMATPHVAGLAALLFQAKPSATVDEVEAAIYASCKRPATMPQERANRGIPNAPAALEALMNNGAQAGKVKKKKKNK